MRGLFSRIPRRRGRQPSNRGHHPTILLNFPKRLHELRKFWAVGERAPGAPPHLDPPLIVKYRFISWRLGKKLRNNHVVFVENYLKFRPCLSEDIQFPPSEHHPSSCQSLHYETPPQRSTLRPPPCALKPQSSDVIILSEMTRQNSNALDY